MAKLRRSDKQQIEAILARYKTNDRTTMSVQDSIPFQRMYPDGVCCITKGNAVTENTYSKTIKFADINYQLSTNDDKSAIFEGWCDFLNYFDSSIRFQLSFINRSANRDSYSQNLEIPLQGDDFDDIRSEYTDMLKNQLAKGNNGLIKTKFLTFTIEANSIKAAKPRLERIETDLLNNFKRLGIKAETLNGYDRLEVMYGIFHLDEPEPFSFSWDWLAPSGLSVKDFIAPSSFEFKNGKYFHMGNKYGTASFLQIIAPELNDRLLADLLDMEKSPCTFNPLIRQRQSRLSREKSLILTNLKLKNRKKP